MMRIPRGARRLAAAFGALFLSGCGLVDSITDPVFQIEFIQLRAEDDANDRSPTAVDLVFVYHAGIVDTIQSVTAADWFTRRQQFDRDFPDGIAVMSWEVVPNSSLPVWEVPEEFLENGEGDKAVAAFVFANFLSPGEHRARLETRIGTRIELLRDTFQISAYLPDS